MRQPINLAEAPGARETWDRPTWWILAWAVVEPLLLRNPLQLSSRLRVATLRFFGAQIGRGVICRPGLRVRFPWKLAIGDRCWLGEDVWLHNQDQLTIGADVVISQGSFVTTGTHAYRDDMALLTRPVTVEAGAWITSRAMILGGVTVGRNALVLPNTVVRRDVPPNAMFGAADATVVGQRFSPSKDSTNATYRSIADDSDNSD
ncbi:MAG: acetyltransferase [Actinobacteria bacterium]|nr:acetyltransferase [Actinomycetota bacterium]MBU2111013.1 acetyltransferase [Actinomycetota bacterium]